MKIQIHLIFLFYSTVRESCCDKVLRQMEKQNDIAARALASLVDHLTQQLRMEFRIVVVSDDLNSKKLATRIIGSTIAPVSVHEIDNFISKFNLFNATVYNSRRFLRTHNDFRRFTTSFIQSIQLNYACEENFIETQYQYDTCTRSKGYTPFKHTLFHLTYSNESGGKMNLYNCKLFSSNCDPKWSIVNIFKSNDSKWMSSDFLQKDIKYNNCRVTIYVIDVIFEPYGALVKIQKEKDDTLRLSGVEGSLIQLFAEMKSIKFINFKKKLGEEPSYEFVFNAMRSEFLLCEYPGDDNSHFSITMPLLTIPGTFAATSGLPYTPAEKLMLPFDTAIWTALILTICFILLAIFIILRMSKEVQNFVFGFKTQSQVFRILQILFGIPTFTIPGRNFSRFIYTIFTLAFLVIRHAYQGKLFEFITGNVRHRTAKTIKDMFDMEIPILIQNSEHLRNSL